MTGIFQTLGAILLGGLVCYILSGGLRGRRARRENQRLRLERAALDERIKEELDRHWYPQPVVPDPTRDQTGSAPVKWDCMVRGHVCAVGSAYCLECRMLIG